MKQSCPPRILLAGAGSGCGKTTVTCAVLGALKKRGVALSAFKAGPDYIDPMFHSRILGTRSRNLDLFLMGRNGVLASLAENSRDSRLAVIEGVMGFYDGLGRTAQYSSCHLSNETGTPAVLVLGCRGMSLTVCALLQGLRDFGENRVRGVILNQVSGPKMADMYRDMIEERTGLRVYGWLPPMPEVRLESRHLGLVTAAEVDRLKEMADILAAQAERTLDLDGLLELGDTAGPIAYEELPVRPVAQEVSIGVARDKAFCFYYEDSLGLLERLGARLVPFSPLEDAALPEGLSGLLLGGGYPELYLEQLSGNAGMLRSIREAWRSGMPIYGECGGFQYLQEAFEGPDGTAYPLVGALASTSRMTEGLRRFGYVTLTAREDTLLCRQGDRVPAHEFHYGDSTDCGAAFLAEKVSTGATYPCMAARGRLLAGYPHLHFYGTPEMAERFVRACDAYRREAGGRAEL